MDSKILFLALVVIGSGCVHQENLDPGTTNTGPSEDLKIESFDVSDDTLSPGQNGVVTLRLRNYHQGEIEIRDSSLYNTELLEVEKLGCSPETIESAREDYKPGMECRWQVNLPEDRQGGIESHTIPIKLNLEYTAELSNRNNPLKIHFMPLDEIERTAEVSKTYSNGEVEMQVSTESPVPFEGRTVEIRLSNAGPGRVSEGFEMRYTPSSVFSECPSVPEPVIEQEVTFTCTIDPETESSSTRNLIYSTSYKYVKAPTLDIEVVNRE